MLFLTLGLQVCIVQAMFERSKIIIDIVHFRPLDIFITEYNHR